VQWTDKTMHWQAPFLTELHHGKIDHDQSFDFFLKKITNTDKNSIDLSYERIPSIPLKVNLLLISSGSLQLSDGHNDG
jgi:hypothetical protein